MRIALCGEARSGKDTVAEILKKLDSGFGTDIMAFGNYMKKSYYDKFPEMVGKPKDREHMIEFSQPIVDIYPKVWVNMLELEIELLSYQEDAPLNCVITDLRQPHEEQWCRDNGFHIVRVHAKELDRYGRMKLHGEKPQKDLTYWVNADFHVYNDGTLDDLKINVKQLLRILTTYDKIKTVTKEANTYGHTEEDLNCLSKLMHCGDK